ncbi:hypothetical protein [Methylorubrum extorquens]|uniref:hypothetical protein n=1 Tax=Methylorubrum extorquens TaxID=408 RepID=UPI00209E9204|nr:hypothetical protein [Methylorubrum extorquens]MCP1540106.1 sporulation protein YlmC with PRC-barrel domain [Methylorubrum extorquens]
MDPEHYDAGVEERVSNPHQPFIVINAAEGTAREIAERAAAVLATGNGVGIDYSDILILAGATGVGIGETAFVLGQRQGKSLMVQSMIEEMMPAIRSGTVVVDDERIAAIGKELVLAVVDEFQEEMTTLMPERNYRAMHRLLNKAEEPMKDACLLGPVRPKKHWVQRQDWKQRERGGRRR